MLNLHIFYQKKVTKRHSETIQKGNIVKAHTLCESRRKKSKNVLNTFNGKFVETNIKKKKN